MTWFIANTVKVSTEIPLAQNALDLRFITEEFKRGDRLSMNIDEFCSRSGMSMPADDILLSAAYLESKGFKFLVDYDMENAVDFATRLMQRENDILNFSNEKKACQTEAYSSPPPALLSVAIAGIDTARHSVARNWDLPTSKARSIRLTLARRRRIIKRRSL